eukprot:CFRG3014T1
MSLDLKILCRASFAGDFSALPSELLNTYNAIDPSSLCGRYVSKETVQTYNVSITNRTGSTNKYSVTEVLTFKDICMEASKTPRLRESFVTGVKHPSFYSDLSEAKKLSTYSQKLPKEIHYSRFYFNIDRTSSTVQLVKVYFDPWSMKSIGVVKVQSLNFHILVMARYSCNNCQTWSEELACYSSQQRCTNVGEDHDYFFCLKLNKGSCGTERILFAVRYNENDLVFWDSNNSSKKELEDCKTFKAQSGPKLLFTTTNVPGAMVQYQRKPEQTKVTSEDSVCHLYFVANNTTRNDCASQKDAVNTIAASAYNQRDTADCVAVIGHRDAVRLGSMDELGSTPAQCSPADKQSVINNHHANARSSRRNVPFLGRDKSFDAVEQTQDSQKESCMDQKVSSNIIPERYTCIDQCSCCAGLAVD